MTRVAVTGGTGKLGRVVVAHLRERGYDVEVLDHVVPPGWNAGITRVDLTDYGQVLGARTGVDDRYASVDAVVHLAAIPAPGIAPNAATFANNVLSTYNVFEACRVAGIERIVWASSETVLGLPFDEPPPYVPIDEDYRVRPESAYSLGKAVDEELAHHFCRWNPRLRIVGLRFSNVMYPEEYAEFPSYDQDPELRKWNLWGYIDARDGAQAVQRALETAATGYDVFILATAATCMSTPSMALVALVFPDVEVRRHVEGTDTLLSIDKARRLLGYEPEHSWRDHWHG
jgi:nucleoside-diphosphate-sugar epimerase